MGNAKQTLCWVTRGESLTHSEPLSNARNERFRNPRLQGPLGLVVSVQGPSLERLRGCVKPRREGRGWGAGHAHHRAGLCGQLDLQLAAVGAKVRSLQPRGVCLLEVPQAGNRVWGRPWKSGQNFLEKAALAAFYGDEGPLGDSPTLR